MRKYSIGDRVGLLENTQILSIEDVGTIINISPFTQKYEILFDTYTGWNKQLADDFARRKVVVSCESHKLKLVRRASIKPTDACECGSKNPPSQGHSHWCKLYRQEFLR